MNITLFDGRPADVTGRLPREVRVYDWLDRLGIPYKRTDHEPGNTMELCLEIDKVLGVVICKNLFLCESAAADACAPGNPRPATLAQFEEMFRKLM